MQLPGHRFIAILAMALSTTASAGTLGSFRGVLIESGNPKPGWVYVQSRNNMLRLVKVTAATVVYSDDVPENQRRGQPGTSLRPGAEVRVMAEQDDDGAWQAKKIEILRLAPTRSADK